MEKKKYYSEPELEILFFDVYGKSMDIITTSGGGTTSPEDGSIDQDAWDT